MSAVRTRSDRQKKYLQDVIAGKQSVQNVNDFKRFVEAVLAQIDHSVAVERLMASPSALTALQKGLRFSTTADFINQYTAKLLQYLSGPGIKNLCNGQFLERILLIFLEPRTLWNAWMEAFASRKLDDNAIYALTWMMTELLSLPSSCGVDVIADAQTMVNDGSLLRSPSIELRGLGHKLNHFLQMKCSGGMIDSSAFTAGGRHDNDFPDFRKIAILPTSDEFSCTGRPFFRRAEDIGELQGHQRVTAFLDNQFRLLREDMLSELREDVQIANGRKKGRKLTFRLRHLSVARLSCGRDNDIRLHTCCLGVSCKSGLENISQLSKEKRVSYVKENRNFVKHQAFGCLTRGAEIVAFATIERDEDALVAEPPIVMLRIAGDEAFKKTLLYLKLYSDVHFVLVDTPMFAYEPILKCLQETVDLPLTKELFLQHEGQSVNESKIVSLNVVNAIKEHGNGDMQSVLGISKPLESLLAGLTQRVSLIQGPPGTGKSFIGALLTKVLHDHTKEKILVMCYTNHALDQFLEDLLDVGIDPSGIVRIGSKSTARTQPLSLFEQRSSYKRSKESWNILNRLRSDAYADKEALHTAFTDYQNLVITPHIVMDYLEFEEPEIYDALVAPEDEDGMTVVGSGGHAIGKDYLYARWVKGMDAGVFADRLPEASRSVWEMSKEARNEKHRVWEHAILDEQITTVKTHAAQFNKCCSRLESLLGEKTRDILRSKRIIGCTTTASAKYSKVIRNVSPGIVLLEEAGEILESHVLAALAPETRQLVLIGDHLQLRPKINEYALSIEKGDGYNLNVSLFERLIHVGYPHTTLLKQHRMCPEISTLVRRLTYPNLEDDRKTLSRPRPRGLQDRVIFFQHEHPEVSFAELSDKRDEGSKQSKKNAFEAEIVLQVVKYLGQQGYGTDKLVVLTPYLGQLHLLREMLSKQNDPVLNDLDSYDLVKAGLLSQAGANHSKRRIKLSTIDNYQGEECEIVIASLTRSNKNGDIGFMAAPQRLTVLLSRARNVLIIVGNAKTFVSSRKGEKTWRPFMDHLKSNRHLYDGLPVRCEQHPQKTAILKTKDEFESECPDGGCPAPCGVKLGCGIHECPSRCHQPVDHSKMNCTRIVEWTCSRGHCSSQACAQVKGACRFCNEEDRAKERKRQRNLKLEAERERRQKEYTRHLAEAQDEIAYLRRLQRDQSEEDERMRVLREHWDEVHHLKNIPKRQDPAIRTAPTTVATKGISDTSTNSVAGERVPQNSCRVTGRQNKSATTSSAAKDDWEYQKTFLNAQSREIDTLMEMIGLESIKEKFLAFKAKVDVCFRQGVDLQTERFGSVLLGNPGTGKTTVARLYARFLASVGIIPGDTFIETTGSRLANDGVSGCQKTLEKILNTGGGALFIDEAYQLAQGSSFGGTQVLDFLLAEVENLTGKIVFILAGYQQPMEKFFSHNLGLPSRFPHELKFNDYDDDEFLKIFDYSIKKHYKNQMKVEDGPSGLYSRIVARRVGRGRGREGFANARAIENIRARIAERQSERLKWERLNRVGQSDDFLLTKEDLIGPEPSRALESSSAWQKLKSMIGLGSVKTTVQSLLDSIQYNYQRELQELPPVGFALNRVFLGSPGTGKTTVAKLYGQILVGIGMLSNGEVVVKNPSDFVGSVIGESEKNTKGILASTLGKVLVIDEAYGLFAGGTSDGTGAKSDQYRSAVVDTIVAEVQSMAGEDRCVLLLGYREQMQQMFQNVNPGLSRRFPLDQALEFQDFTKEELDQILTMKLKEQGFNVTERGRRVALEMLERARNRPNFGNAGEVDILLNSAKMRHQRRISCMRHVAGPLHSTLDAEDFDEDFDRRERDDKNVARLFEGVVGCDEIIAKLEGYREIVRKMTQLECDPRKEVPFNFLFRGPPGTGKTSTARKMGQIYYDMGLLASADVVEVSTTDLVGQYVGQTGPKTQKALERALGKVLFIDEAYRLADGQFGQQAMDEMVDRITKPQFAQRLIIILAGYDADINRLMAINPGLTSRFPESLQFNSLSAPDCIALLTSLFQKRKKDMQDKSNVEFDLGVLEHPRDDFRRDLIQHFNLLSRTASWANARDIDILAKDIFRKVLQGTDRNCLVITETAVLQCVDQMVTERLKREQCQRTHHLPSQDKAEATSLSLPVRVNSHSSSNTEMATSNKPDAKHRSLSGLPPTDTGPRDTEVTDEVWSQLQQDKAAAEAREKEYLDLRAAEEKQAKALRKAKEDEDIVVREVEEARRSGHEETRARHEQTRLQRELERRAREEELEKIRKQREQVERNRRREQQAQAKLREMGVCVMGYRWIKQTGGYRCAGGSHWVSDAQLRL
ncbi:P-loop containing nucleoside triphosphate hydrolase protein [Aspergillus vadensis CBS 113365]|uniref:P-loop containing nucleoside triphosphate hydrolase protein n=1 Tax=Aspergillus vadensis (strain CBS 113365 / IMI 142717 / IBT 24658) TaxID=1448311 RepID=A0A319AUT3_ASPVC|nr:P-loop containing nucleoside triphosphate hydrolase protein [Aspergillus vadensis CBS 113365]PYH64019.1 P-loop containing nucleoside triphosphate hydrolase protein [Aspergillus vadensis CBS 113365]